MNRFDAEAAVCGALMLDAQAYWRVADVLTADDFHDDRLRDLFGIVAALAKRGVPADAVTVGEQNPDMAAFAAQTANATPGSANVRAYAEIVARDAVARRVRIGGQRIAKLAGDDVLGEAQRILGACAPNQTGSVKPVREFLRESVTRMQERFDATEVLTGVPTGIEKLDELTAGLQRGDLIVIAARPSVGKTALALQLSLHAAGVGHPVLFASLEMSGSQIADRALSHLAAVSCVSIREPKRLEEHEWAKVSAAGAKLGALPFFIDDSSGLTVEGICARVRQMNSTKRLGLAVIDYLGLMKLPRAEKKTDAIGEVTRQLKGLAKELQIPVILLCQLNRGADNSEPRLSSLRDSGDIEQDADVVVFLHRPDESDRGHVKAIVAKQRNGPCDHFFMAAKMDVMRFDRCDDYSQPQATSARFGPRKAVA